jgi:hypothetical protein
LRFIRGDVLYERFAVDGARKGSLDFGRFYATAYNLTNLPAEPDGLSGSQMDVVARLAGVGPLSLHMELDLTRPDFDLSYVGTMGSMNLELLNDLLIPTEGLRIRSGNLEEARFTVSVEDGVASGYFDALYDDLHIVEVNKVSGRSRLMHRIRSFLLNNTRLKSRNREEEGQPERRGTVSYTYKDTETFLRFLWISTRSGIFSITGMND